MKVLELLEKACTIDFEIINNSNNPNCYGIITSTFNTTAKELMSFGFFKALNCEVEYFTAYWSKKHNAQALQIYIESDEIEVS